MKDLYNHITPVQAIAPVLVLDATVPAAVEVDLVNFNSAVISVNCGAKAAGDTGTITIALTHADDDGTGASGDYADVAAKDVQGATPATGVVFTLAAAAVAAAIYKIGYIGGKRFVKLTTAEAGSNATGTIIGVTVIKSHGLDVPAI